MAREAVRRLGVGASFSVGVADVLGRFAHSCSRAERGSRLVPCGFRALNEVLRPAATDVVCRLASSVGLEGRAFRQKIDIKGSVLRDLPDRFAQSAGKRTFGRKQRAHPKVD